MKMNPVGWFEIYVSDLERAKTFYQNVFEFQFQDAPKNPKNPSLTMSMFKGDMNLPGASGALCKMDGYPSGQLGTLVYFSSPDCGVHQERVVAAGGKVQKPKTSIGEYGFMCLVYDTEGNMFGIHSMK